MRMNLGSPREIAEPCCGSTVAAYFVKLAAILHKHGSGDGITTYSLFRRGCRGRESDGGSRAKPAHVTTFVEPADSGSGRRGRCPTADAHSSRDRTDTGGAGPFPSPPPRAIAWCGGDPSGSCGRSSRPATPCYG